MYRLNELSATGEIIETADDSERAADPGIAEIAVGEAEDLVYVRRAGGGGFDGIQGLEDLRNNWNRLLDAAGRTPDERRQAVDLFNRRVGRVPGTQI